MKSEPKMLKRGASGHQVSGAAMLRISLSSPVHREHKRSQNRYRRQFTRSSTDIKQGHGRSRTKFVVVLKECRDQRCPKAADKSKRTSNYISSVPEDQENSTFRWNDVCIIKKKDLISLKSLLSPIMNE